MAGKMMRGFVLLAAFAVASCNQPSESAEGQKGMPVGRWTIIYSPHVQRSTMLLDTATGKTWNLVTEDKGENPAYAWESVEKSDDNASDWEVVETENSN